MNIVFIGSHLGYPMDRTPLGGGAMVGLRLIRHWLREGACELTVIGSGPQAPAPGAFYVRLPEGGRTRPGAPLRAGLRPLLPGFRGRQLLSYRL